MQHFSYENKVLSKYSLFVFDWLLSTVKMKYNI